MIINILIGTTVGALVTAGLLGWLLWRESSRTRVLSIQIGIVRKQRDQADDEADDLRRELQRVTGNPLRVVR